MIKASRLPLACLILLAPVVIAQDAPPPKAPAYDVVSVKVSDPSGHRISVRVNDDILTTIGTPLKVLIAEAYSIQEDLIYGLPDWANSARFDIQAKVLDADKAALNKLARDARGAMLQPVLADRFQLKCHTEVRTLPVYELVLLKSGPKFDQASPADKNKRFHDTSAGSMTIHNGELVGHDIPLARLVIVLAHQLHRAVIDKTRLTGSYDLVLNWTPEEAPPSPDATAPNLVTALQEQLGLKLQSAKGPVETLFIDQVQMPSED